MALSGKLGSWNDERGFGFIAPRDGGREVFVHISSFPRDGSRPTVGETLSYELGRGKDGKPQAVNVYRQALGKPSTCPRRATPARRASRSPFGALVGLVLLVALGGLGYAQYTRHAASAQAAAAGVPQGDSSVAEAVPTGFRCDGRTHCSQMTSCSEAKYFLKHCPDTRMDGNHDGVPCEQQWCTSVFAK